MLRLLDDADVKDIMNFEKANVVRNGKDFFCDIEMNKVYLLNAPLLRKCMFDGTIMFVGDYDESGNLKKLCMFALPYQSTKSTVVKVFFCNKEAEFVRECMSVLCDFIEGTIYTKIRITTYGDINKQSLIPIYEACGMQEESHIMTNAGERYVYSRFIEE